MSRTIVFAAAVSLLAAATTLSAGSAEEAEIKSAALDYVEGFYEGDDSKLRRSVRPEVTKFGFARRSADQPYQGMPMSFDQMIEYAERVQSSGDTAPDDAPKNVIILDQMDQIAVVRVDAFWGSDYLQMAKYDGRWQILHVIWQTPEAE